MKHRTILVTLSFTSGLIATVIAIFLLAGSGTLAQAAPSIVPGNKCDKADSYNHALVGESFVASGVGVTCTQLLEAGDFEGNLEDVFPPWHAGNTPGAWQRDGYFPHWGAFSVHLHASQATWPCDTTPPYDPWLYQTVQIPVGISATTRITVEGYYAVGGSRSECSVYGSTDADDELYVQLRDGEGIPISDAVLITHGGGFTNTWQHFGVDFTDDVDLESLAGQDVRVTFFAIHDADRYGTYFYLDDLEFNVCPYQSSPELAISKTGPSKAKPGESITYTLTVTNHGPITATNVLITDVVPGGANVVEPVPGGTVDLPVVTWMVEELAPNDTAISVQFAVTATRTITNSDYGVSCAEGMSATGSEVVVTRVGRYEIYLPVILR